MTIRVYKESQSKEDLKEDLEDWAQTHGAFQVSENHVSYGRRLMKKSEIPNGFKEWNKKWTKVCKQYSKVNEARKKLLAIRNVPPCNKGGI